MQDTAIHLHFIPIQSIAIVIGFWLQMVLDADVHKFQYRCQGIVGNYKYWNIGNGSFLFHTIFYTKGISIMWLPRAINRYIEVFDMVMKIHNSYLDYHINGLLQERLNSIANTLVWRLSCSNPSILEIMYLNVSTSVMLFKLGHTFYIVDRCLINYLNHSYSVYFLALVGTDIANRYTTTSCMFMFHKDIFEAFYFDAIVE